MKMSGYSRTKEELRKRILSRCDGRFRSSAIFNVAEWVDLERNIITMLIL